jgi:ribonuclease HI
VSEIKTHTVYTDGACPGNGTEDATGGMGIARLTGDFYDFASKGFLWGHHLTKRYGHPTNQKCELFAAMIVVSSAALCAQMYKGYLYAKDGKISEMFAIHSDSKYVVDGVNHWLRNWKQNDWKNSKKKTISNLQMWKDLDLMLSYGHLRGCVSFSYVPGHSGDPGNETADEAARLAADGQMEGEFGVGDWSEYMSCLANCVENDEWLE